jgi:hypothetical protein
VSGKRYWSSGIFVTYLPEPGSRWSGTLRFSDDGSEEDSEDAGYFFTTGELSTRYFPRQGRTHASALAQVTDALIEKAERLDVEFRYPYLQAKGKELKELSDWDKILADEADRLGWGFWGQ